VDDKADRFAQRIEQDFKVMMDRGLELITVRHHQPAIMEELRKGKIVLLEERIKDTTIQMVVKDVPVMRRKEVPTA
jgi:aspartate kinase